MDKLYIDGHYYSDKSPVPNLILAGIYWIELQLGMPSATQRPDLFAYTFDRSNIGSQLRPCSIGNACSIGNNVQ